VSAIIDFIQPQAAFDPEAISVMGDAYERALKSIEASAPSDVREVIAARIISMARAGERDPRKLCEESLVILGVSTNRG
jgi:hypothetical protein